jgi:hypothetical protein
MRSFLSASPLWIASNTVAIARASPSARRIAAWRRESRPLDDLAHVDDRVVVKVAR